MRMPEFKCNLIFLDMNNFFQDEVYKHCSELLDPLHGLPSFGRDVVITIIEKPEKNVDFYYKDGKGDFRLNLCSKENTSFAGWEGEEIELMVKNYSLTIIAFIFFCLYMENEQFKELLKPYITGLEVYPDGHFNTSTKSSKITAVNVSKAFLVLAWYIVTPNHPEHKKIQVLEEIKYKLYR